MNKAKSSMPNANGTPGAGEPIPYRSNPEVDAKIDSYIKENPKYWAYVQGMPRERMERTLVLNEVRELDRQQRMREAVLKQINKSPALKTAYETLVKDLPEEQREGVITQLARQTKRAVARSQNQQNTTRQGIGV